MQLRVEHLEIGNRVRLHDDRTGRIFDIDPIWRSLGCGCCTESAGWEIWVEMDDESEDEIIEVGLNDEIEEIVEILDS